MSLGNVFINTAFSLQDFQYPFDKQDCAGTIDLPWKNNSTVALTKSRNPITILGIVETDLRLLISCFPGERVLATFKVGQMRAETNLTLKGSSFRFHIELIRIFNSVVITLFLQVPDSLQIHRIKSREHFRHSSSGSSCT